MKKKSLLLLFCLKISYTGKKPHEKEKRPDEIDTAKKIHTIKWNETKERAKTYQRRLALKIKAAMEENEGLELAIPFGQPQPVTQPQGPTMLSFLNNFLGKNTEINDTQQANELMESEENA